MAFDSRRRLADITCPTLVVAAANDDAVPLHHAKMLHDGIRGSQLLIIDDANHALIWMLLRSSCELSRNSSSPIANFSLVIDLADSKILCSPLSAEDAGHCRLETLSSSRSSC